MAYGKCVEDWKWYVRREPEKTADCGPYLTEERATAALDQRKEQLGGKAPKLYVEHVNVAALRVIKRLLPDEAVAKKRRASRSPRKQRRKPWQKR